MVDFSGEEEIYPGARMCGLRLRFLPCQAGADACIGAVEGSIRDTYLQRGLKDHPFVQAKARQDPGLGCLVHLSSATICSWDH